MWAFPGKDYSSAVSYADDMKSILTSEAGTGGLFFVVVVTNTRQFAEAARKTPGPKVIPVILDLRDPIMVGSELMQEAERLR